MQFEWNYKLENIQTYIQAKFAFKLIPPIFMKTYIDEMHLKMPTTSDGHDVSRHAFHTHQMSF